MGISAKSSIKKIDGFVAEISRLYKLPAKTFVPSVVFVTTQNVRTSNLAQKQLREVYNAVVRCEARNDHRRFNCTWFRQILAQQTEEEKTEFITQSIFKAWSNVASNVCRLQWKTKKVGFTRIWIFFFLWVSGHRKGIGRLSLFLLSRLPITSVLLNLFFFCFCLFFTLPPRLLSGLDEVRPLSHT